MTIPLCSIVGKDSPTIKSTGRARGCRHQLKLTSTQAAQLWHELNLTQEPQIYQFHPFGCIRLPAPTIQHPELLNLPFTIAEDVFS